MTYAPVPPPLPKTPEQRRAALAWEISHAVTRGWRVESQSDYSAVLVSGHRPNHVLHFLISLFTCGLWVVVWLLVALAGGEKRAAINIPE